MSLDVYLTAIRPTCVFDANITHNLGKMADEAGIYQHVWRSEELGIETAQELIEPLRAGIALLESDPDRFIVFSPSNEWGTYSGLLRWLREYLRACEENPDATIKVSR